MKNNHFHIDAHTFEEPVNPEIEKEIMKYDSLLMAKKLARETIEKYANISGNTEGKIEVCSVEDHIKNSKGDLENRSGDKSLNA